MAHPERYPYLKTEDDYDKLKNIGCQLQVNILSLTGYYGKPALQAAKTLLQSELVEYLSTDLHHERHVINLRETLSHEMVINALSKYAFLNATL